MYERVNGSSPRTLREDFCGTAAFAAAWVKAHRENRAIGVDLDPDPLDWGRRHNLATLRPEQARRITLLQDDVRTARTPKVDVLVAFNFSFFLFKQRAALLDYFRRCHAHVKSDGIFVIDAYGGPESMEKRRGTPPRRQLHLHLGPVQLRPDHPRRVLPHPLRVPRRLEDRARLDLSLAAVDDRRTARAARRGRLRVDRPSTGKARSSRPTSRTASSARASTPKKTRPGWPIWWRRSRRRVERGGARAPHLRAAQQRRASKPPSSTTARR